MKKIKFIFLFFTCILACSGNSQKSVPGPQPQISCNPGETRSCYSGPVGTADMGICKSGTQTCASDGLSFGTCIGEVLPITEDCFTKNIDEDCDSDPNDNFCAGETIFSKRFGAGSGEAVRSVTIDANQNIILSGNFQDTVDFGTGPLVSQSSSNVFLAKYDSNGSAIWSRVFGDSNTSASAYSAVTDATGAVIVTGAFNDGTINFGNGDLTSAGGYDIFVVKFDTDGNVLWSHRYGDADSQSGDSIGVDAAGNIFVSGSVSGSVDFGSGVLTSSGSSDAYLIKLNPNGNLIWARLFGDLAAQSGDALAVDANGNVALIGTLAGSANFGAGPISSAGDTDVFVAKFDAAGNHLWSQRYGNAASQYGFDAKFDTAGNLWINGGFDDRIDFGGGVLSSDGSTDIFLVKLDANGNFILNQKIGGVGSDYPGRIMVNSDFAVITGSFFDTINLAGSTVSSQGNSDAFVLKLNTEGGSVWGRSFGGTQTDSGSAVAINSLGQVVFTGMFSGVFDFGAGPLTAEGFGDIFLVKLAR